MAGITAHLIRYVDLMLLNPWTLELAEKRGFPVADRPLTVRVAAP